MQRKNSFEIAKTPSRTEIINFLLSIKKEPTTYLEIGVQIPEDNFGNIKANTKYSVDPGLEYKKNPVDFQMTSGVFFKNFMQMKYYQMT